VIIRKPLAIITIKYSEINNIKREKPQLKKRKTPF
jgi:hypothetical protein